MTPHNCFVSVITPALNSGKHIGNCISSVKKQRVGAEHIIVDGGSSDDTINILKEQSHLRWVTESDNGMYDAINKGVELANGDIIGYLNSDDRYYGGTIERVVSVFNSKPDIDFAYGGCTYIDQNEKDLFTFKPLPYSNSILKNMQRICWAQPSCFWRKSVHDRIGKFDSSLKFCGDHAFFLSLLVNNLKGHRINRPLSRFMIHDNALSVTAKDEMAEEFIQIESKLNLKRNFLLGLWGEIYFKLINFAVYPKIAFYRK